MSRSVTAVAVHQNYLIITYQYLFQRTGISAIFIPDARSIGVGIKSLYCISNQGLCGRHGQ